MIPFKISTVRAPGDSSPSADPVSFSVPQFWHEVTFGQFQKVKEAMNQGPLLASDLLAAFTGLEKKFWVAVPEQTAAPVLQVIKGFWDNPEETPDFFNLPVPKSVTIGGKKIPISSAPGSYALGQGEAMNQKFKAWADSEEMKSGSIHELIVKGSEVVALMLQPAYYGKGFDEEESKQLIPLVDMMQATEAVPLASFFLSIFLKRLQTGLKHLGKAKKKTPLLMRLGLKS